MSSTPLSFPDPTRILTQGTRVLRLQNASMINVLRAAVARETGSSEGLSAPELFLKLSGFDRLSPGSTATCSVEDGGTAGWSLSLGVPTQPAWVEGTAGGATSSRSLLLVQKQGDHAKSICVGYLRGTAKGAKCKARMGGTDTENDMPIVGDTTAAGTVSAKIEGTYVSLVDYAPTWHQSTVDPMFRDLVGVHLGSGEKQELKKEVEDRLRTMCTATNGLSSRLLSFQTAPAQTLANGIRTAFAGAVRLLPDSVAALAGAASAPSSQPTHFAVFNIGTLQLIQATNYALTHTRASLAMAQAAGVPTPVEIDQFESQVTLLEDDLFRLRVHASKNLMEDVSISPADLNNYLATVLGLSESDTAQPNFTSFWPVTTNSGFGYALRTNTRRSPASASAPVLVQLIVSGATQTTPLQTRSGSLKITMALQHPQYGARSPEVPLAAIQLFPQPVQTSFITRKDHEQTYCRSFLQLWASPNTISANASVNTALGQGPSVSASALATGSHYMLQNYSLGDAARGILPYAITQDTTLGCLQHQVNGGGVSNSVRYKAATMLWSLPAAGATLAHAVPLPGSGLSLGISISIDLVRQFSTLQENTSSLTDHAKDLCILPIVLKQFLFDLAQSKGITSATTPAALSQIFRTPKLIVESTFQRNNLAPLEVAIDDGNMQPEAFLYDWIADFEASTLNGQPPAWSFRSLAVSYRVADVQEKTGFKFMLGFESVGGGPFLQQENRASFDSIIEIGRAVYVQNDGSDIIPRSQPVLPVTLLFQ